MREDTARTSIEIARRVLALHCVIVAAHGVSKEVITEWLQEERLWDALTPRELRFMSKQENPRKDFVRMTWFVESQVALLWAIEKLGHLPSLTTKCDTGPVVGAMPLMFNSTLPFIESASLRSLSVLHQEEEQLYDIRCHVNRPLRGGKAAPDKEVAFFRHYGLLWVVGYCGQSWDDITPDI